MATTGQDQQESGDLYCYELLKLNIELQSTDGISLYAFVLC